MVFPFYNSGPSFPLPAAGAGTRYQHRPCSGFFVGPVNRVFWAENFPPVLDKDEGSRIKYGTAGPTLYSS